MLLRMHWCLTRQRAAIAGGLLQHRTSSCSLNKIGKTVVIMRQHAQQVSIVSQGPRPAPPHLCCQPPLLPEALPSACGLTTPRQHLHGQTQLLQPQLAGLLRHLQPVCQSCWLAAHAQHLRCVKSRLHAAPQAPQATRLPHRPGHLGSTAGLVPCRGYLRGCPLRPRLAAHLAARRGCLRCWAQRLCPPVLLLGPCSGCGSCATSAARRCARLCAWHAA